MAYNLRPGTNRPVTSTARTIANWSPAKKQAFRQWVAGAVNKQQAPQAAPAPQPAPQAGGATFVLPGSAEANFAAQRSNIGETYTEETALNNYKVRNADIAHDRDVRDQRIAYERAREDFPTSYIQRGIFGGHGGVYSRDLTRFAEARARQQADTRQDYTRELAGLRLSREGIERRRALALANLAMKHQAVRNDAAARSIK